MCPGGQQSYAEGYFYATEPVPVKNILPRTIQKKFTKIHLFFIYISLSIANMFLFVFKLVPHVWGLKTRKHFDSLTPGCQYFQTPVAIIACCCK